MNNDPIIKQALGSEWNKLSKHIKSHYHLEPYSSSRICITGIMDEIYHSPFAKLFVPIGWLLGAIIPFNKTNVATEVIFKTEPTSSKLYWQRIFRFNNGKTFNFNSHMELFKDKTIIEFVRFGVGMVIDLSVKDGVLLFQSRKFIWRLFGINIPLPLRLLLGTAYVEERIVDNNFTMKLLIKHPLFGELFRYSGAFSLK